MPPSPKARSRRLFELLEPRCVLNAGPIITEFMASNDGSLLDGDGKSSDWVEIFNPTSQTINLAGWHLTDRANNLDKWTFPAAPQSILGPGEYLIVFASSQPTETYIDPAGYLHADFALGAEGEFLALTDPGENIVWMYTPAFPPQLQDISYGVNTGTVTLVGESSTTSALVPTSGDLDTGPSPVWTQPGFDDSSWVHSAAGVGVGFDNAPGHVAGPPNGTLLAALKGNDLTDPEEDGVLNVALNVGGAAGSPTAETPPRALDGTKNTKWLSFLPEGTYYEMRFLDNVPRIVDGYTISSANDDDRRDPYSWTLSGSNDGVNYTVVDTRNAQNFATRFETRLYEFVNTTPYRYYKFDFQTEYGVTGNNYPSGPAIQLSEIELLSSQEFNYGPQIDVDLVSEWNNTKSSVYQRVEFNVADPATLGALWLDMQYNDGFVAYLNGTQVVASNAPASPNWQSHALAPRDHSLGVVPERFNLSSFHHLLTAGTNVLAIHVLNASDASDDLLSVPKLTAVDLAATSPTEYYYSTPTPGAANGEGNLGFVATPTFSVPRGFYEENFTLIITSATPGAEIYYTTNGDTPTPTSGTPYTGPIAITGTTVVKAGAFKVDYYDAIVDTHTYLFLRDIVSQSHQTTLNAGFPTTWGGVTPDYGMDPDVIGMWDSLGNPLGGDIFGGQYAATIKNDLLAIPTLSLVMNIDDLLGPNGIYTLSTNSGVAYERATSIELIYPDGTPGFQIDAGLRLHGGAFRQHTLSKKHSMRLLFKADYGATKLEFPFFGDDAVDRFDGMVLRMESNDGYAWNAAGSRAQYARDAFGSRSQLALGQVSSHGNRVHLYINGVYWGVYNPVERPDASFAAMYYGGDKENWDAINDGTPIDGTLDAWNTLVSLSQQVASAGTPEARRAAYQRILGNNPDGTNNPAYETYLDVDNYIDYLLVNFYMGNTDWPQRNWYAARERGPDSTGFKFHMWDAETTMNLGGNVNSNRLGVDIEVAQPYSLLRASEDFRLRFADRAQRALFNDGALTTDQAIARYQEILGEMDRAIVAESARWGDQHSSTPYHRAQWVAEGQSVINTFLAGRTNVFINQLRSAGLYPNVNAPTFSQNGGNVPPGYDLQISGAGAIYYTLDGSDPRAVDGSVTGTLYQGPVDLISATTVKARVLSGGTWSALMEASFTPVSLPGDYNRDLVVDEADYLVWKQDFGSTTNLAADGNGDGIVDTRDFLVWRNNLGASALAMAPNQSAAVVVAAENPTPAAPLAGPDENWYLMPERRAAWGPVEQPFATPLITPPANSPVAVYETSRPAREDFAPASRSDLVDAALSEWEGLADVAWEMWEGI